MRILRAPTSRRISMSFGDLRERRMALVEIRCEDGLTGYGESWINYPPWAKHERVATIRDGVAPLLVGQEASNINTLHAKMVRELLPMGIQWGAVGPIMQAISGADIALWDLKGKAYDLAVSDLLGGRVRDEIPVYASSLGPDNVEELAVRCREAGFTAVKLRVGFGLDTDERNLGVIRDLMGSDIAIFADANQAWTLEEALVAADTFSRHKVEWVEEPVRYNRPEELATFHRETGIGVATGENVYGSRGFFPYANTSSIGTLQPDVSKTGGITETVSVCHLASASDKSIIPHHYGGPISQAATLQIAACMQQVSCVEFDVHENPLREELPGFPLHLENGCLKVSQGRARARGRVGSGGACPICIVRSGLRRCRGNPDLNAASANEHREELTRCLYWLPEGRDLSGRTLCDGCSRRVRKSLPSTTSPRTSSTTS